MGLMSAGLSSAYYQNEMDIEHMVVTGGLHQSKPDVDGCNGKEP